MDVTTHAERAVRTELARVRDGGAINTDDVAASYLLACACPYTGEPAFSWATVPEGVAAEEFVGTVRRLIEAVAEGSVT